jgi:hypothetical protein
MIRLVWQAARRRLSKAHFGIQRVHGCSLMPTWCIGAREEQCVVCFASSCACPAQMFFQNFQALVRYMVFDSWEHLMNFIIQGLILWEVHLALTLSFCIMCRRQLVESGESVVWWPTNGYWIRSLRAASALGLTW